MQQVFGAIGTSIATCLLSMGSGATDAEGFVAGSRYGYVFGLVLIVIVLVFLYFVKLRWTCSALNLDTVGVQLEHRRRLVPCFVVCLVYFMRECLFR